MYKIKKVKDSFQAFLVQDACFTSIEEYPIIRGDMIPDHLPVKIMPFDKALNYHGDLRDVFICFYSPDSSFERVRKDPKRYLKFFKGTAGIIGFDFSIHSDMPIIKQKSQMNDNLSLTYYFGNNDIKIIPNARCGIDELIPEYLKALPKQSIIAVGTHGFCKEKQEKYEWYCFLDMIIKELEPKAIVVYGSLKDNMFSDLKQKTSIVCYEPWITGRWKEVRKNGNKGRK